MQLSRTVKSFISARRPVVSDRHYGYLFIMPAILTMWLVLIYPVIYASYLSLNEVGADFNAHYVGLRNYVEVLQSPKFATALLYTAEYALLSVLLQVILGLGVALLLHQAIRGRAIIRALVMFPWLIPPVVTSMTWAWMLNSEYGIVNHLLKSVGLISVPISWLGTTEWAMPSVILATVWRGFPFAAVMLLAALQAVPEDQLEAAAVDGAAAVARFFYVVLPNISFALIVVTTLSTIWAFKSFDIVQVMTAGGPLSRTEILTILVYKESFRYFRFGYGSTIAMYLLIVLLLFSLIYLYILRKQRD